MKVVGEFKAIYKVQESQSLIHRVRSESEDGIRGGLILIKGKITFRCHIPVYFECTGSCKIACSGQIITKLESVCKVQERESFVRGIGAEGQKRIGSRLIFIQRQISFGCYAAISLEGSCCRKVPCDKEIIG